jgi:nucleoside-diphosphate-sugar epimerase
MERKTSGEREMKILVTGGSGFIGSAFVRRVLLESDHSLRVLVRNTNQRNLTRLNSFEHVRKAEFKGRLHVVYGDLLGDLSDLCEGCDAVVHFAAKTFVDHSIRDPLPFLETNVMGTHRLLEDARRNRVKRFVQVSTDEVYGSILEGAYSEESRINPTNPYAASKAGADALAISYAHSFGLHTTVTRTETNYGIFQHPPCSPTRRCEGSRCRSMVTASTPGNGCGWTTTLTPCCSCWRATFHRAKCSMSLGIRNSPTWPWRRRLSLLPERSSQEP